MAVIYKVHISRNSVTFNFILIQVYWEEKKQNILSNTELHRVALRDSHFSLRANVGLSVCWLLHDYTSREFKRPAQIVMIQIVAPRQFHFLSLFLFFPPTYHRFFRRKIDCSCVFLWSDCRWRFAKNVNKPIKNCYFENGDWGWKWNNCIVFSF